jgi:TctA family transporter
MDNFTTLILVNILIITQLVYGKLALRRFPNKDPFQGFSKLNLYELLLPPLVITGVFVGGYFLSKSLNLLNVYKVVCLLSLTFAGLYGLLSHIRSNKNNDKILKAETALAKPYLRVLYSFLIFGVIAGFLIGFLKLSSIYMYILFVLFLILLVGMIVWSRRSRLKQ